VERYRLHRAVSALCDLLAGDRPLLLAVDDLHWADAASVELLLYLLRRPPTAPLVVAVAFRPRQLHSQTAILLEQIQRDSHGALLELAPLTAAEARTLLPADLPSPVAERIYRDSAGNPFYLKELIRAARRGVQTTGLAKGQAAERLPSTITTVITSELDGLSDGARELIRAASVLGDPFEPEIAGEVIQMDDATTLAALDELVDRDLIQFDQAPGSFSFRHPVVRQAIYESTKGGWRRARAHGRGSERAGRVGAGARASYKALGKAWRYRGDRGARRGGPGCCGPRSGGRSSLVWHCPATVARHGRAGGQGATDACHGRVAGVGGQPQREP
jgi:predicted ATPase